MVKAVLADILMGIGSALAGGCNIGGFYNAVGNLAANGFTMMIGLIAGIVLGLKLLYLEMEHISWGDGGAKTLTPPATFVPWIGAAALVILVVAAYAYTSAEDNYTASLCGVILLAAAIGYCMHRGRWCMMQGFREPHMTGDCAMAKSVMLSICVVALGAAVLKYQVPVRVDADGAAVVVLDAGSYVRGTFGWGGVVGGFIFGLGGMFAGGCGSGTLWRVGEGQVKLMIVVPFFALTNSIFVAWFKSNKFEENGVFGSSVYLPDVFGYGGALILIGLVMALWYVIVTWNEETNKLIVPM